jgi:transposase
MNPLPSSNHLTSATGSGPDGPAPVSVPTPVIAIGIDWADQLHAFAAMLPDGTVETGSFRQQPHAIQQWLDGWQTRFPQARLEIALETSRGGLVNALLQSAAVRLYSLNPHALACFRKSFAHGGGKSDPLDARRIMQYLLAHRAELRPLLLNQPLTRELDELVRHRRRLVDERVRLAHRLKSLLKDYFPALLELAPSKPYAHFLVALLRRYPTLQAVQQAGPRRLRQLLLGLGSRNRVEQRIAILMEAQPLTSDPVILRTHARYAQALAATIDLQNQTIRQYDADLKRLLPGHEDYPLFKTLPGASVRTHARLIAALGDDRSRYATAESLQCAAAIAPLTEQSGKSRHVHRRWAAPTFLMQTFFEFAGLSVPSCAWAKAFYETQRTRGKSAAGAKRALAYKWIRIIHHCWKTRTPYDEAAHLANLRRQASPLALALHNS